MVEYGILNESYHLGRRTKKSFVYRLNRRTEEAIKLLERYCPKKPEGIIDLGAADGLMLSKIKNKFPSARCIGIEYSRELIKTNIDSRISVLEGDINFLPIPNNSFDIAIATAVIEHLPNPKRMLEEAKRVLKLNGLMILTTPDPFWERISTIVGHLSNEHHHMIMNMRELVSIFNEVGYDILEKKKFMLSPVGMPFEIQVEKIVNKIGLKFLFANQLIVGKKIK